MSIVLWPMVMQALVNPTMRPGVRVLCRAVSQIVGDISSASVGETVADSTSSSVQGNQNLETVLVWLLVCAHDSLENLCRRLETVKFDADVWASRLSLDLHHVLSVLKQNDLP